MTEADLSSEIDEIVQVDTRDGAGETRHHFAQLESGLSQANPSTNASHSSSSSSSMVHLTYASPSSMMDESTANGFTTAPATSDEDDDSDDDEEEDSRSNYSNNNTNSNMSVMTNGSSSGGRARGYHGRQGSSSSSGGQFVKGEEKRSHHNVLERKRRDLLKDSFARLRDSVPTTQPKERVSRAEILRHAADFIASTVQKNVAVRAELDELVRKNREFEEKRKQAGAVAGTGAGGDLNLAGVGLAPGPSGTKLEPTIKQES